MTKFTIQYCERQTALLLSQMVFLLMTDIRLISLSTFFQGKVTDVIQSSADDSDWSDDDDDDEGISTQERLSIEIGSIHTTDPPFEEEYEVLSDSGSSIEDPPFFPHQVIVQDFQGYFQSTWIPLTASKKMQKKWLAISGSSL